MAPPGKPESEQYDAFISYNLQDAEFAKVLEEALEAYKPPPGLDLPPRYLRIFRFEGDMTGVEYDKAIQDKIQKSAKLIVICSPAARQKSEYINDEIRRFVQAKGAENIIPLMAAGIPNNEAKPEQAAEMAFPAALCQVQKMPLAADYRDFDPHKDKVNKGEFSNSWYNLLANLYGRSREEIEQRDHKRQLRRRNIITAISFGLLLIFAVIAAYAWLQKSVAETRGKIALSRQLAAQSNNLMESKRELSLLLSLEAARVAEGILNSGNFLEWSLTKAVLGISKEDYNINEPKQALFAALTVPPHRLKFFHQASSAMAFNPDGKKLVFLGSNNDLVVYDLASGHQVRQPLTGIKEFGDVIRHMAVSSGGQLLALESRKEEETQDSPAYITFWYVNTGQPRSPILDLKRVVVAFSPNGKLLAIKNKEADRIEVWDFGNLQMLYSLKIPGKSMELSHPSDLSFSQDSQILLSWHREDKRTRCIRWDLATRQPMNLVIKEDSVSTDETILSPDGKTLAVLEYAAGKQILAFYSMPERKQTCRFPMRESCLREFVFSPDGKNLAMIENEHHGMAVDVPILEKNFVIAYDVPQGKEVGRFLISENLYLNDAAFSPDGKILAANGNSGVYLWEVPHLRPLSPPLRHPDLNGFTFCPDSKHIASCDQQGSIVLWNLTGDPLGRIFEIKKENVGPFVFSHNSQKLAVAEERILEIYDMADVPHVSSTLRFKKDKDTLKIQSGDLKHKENEDQYEIFFNVLAFSPNGQNLAMAESDGDILLVDLNQGIQIGKTISTDEGKIVFGFNSDGQALAASTVYVNFQMGGLEEERKERTISLWNLTRGEFLRKLPGHKGMVTCMAFSPDGRLFTSGDLEGNLNLWDVSTGVNQKLALKLDFSTLAFSPNGQLLACGGGGGGEDIILWDVVQDPQGGAALKRGKTLACKDVGILEPLRILSFSPDGKTLAATNLQGNLILWDVSTGAFIGSTFKDIYKPKTAHIPIGRQLPYIRFFLSYSPDGKTLAFSKYKKEVNFYDAGMKSWKDKARSIANRDLTAGERQKYLHEKP